MIFKRNGHLRFNTNEDINRKIDLEMEARVKYLSLRGKSEIEARMKELDMEWNIERVLQVNGGSLTLTGIILAVLFNKKWLIIPAIASAFMVQHAVSGWSLPLPLFRRFGIRTKEEIDKEKTALKALRGDFKDVSDEKDDLRKADKALKAAF